MTARARALQAGLALTLGASAWLAVQDDAVDAQGLVEARAPRVADAGMQGRLPVPAARVAPEAALSAAAPSAAAKTAAPRRAPWPAAPAPALAAWSAPAASAPAPAAVAAAASQPEATPRFPYTWIGRIDTGGDVQVLLNGPQRSFGARAGEVLDGRWRIEHVAATRLQLTWLPTGQAVTVDAR
jgi:hypothetical protein